EAVTRALTGRPAVTEQEFGELRDLDLRPTLELVRVINAEDETVAAAVASAAGELAHAIDAIVERLRAGGRLIYVGAGTSGRLGAADAAECGPTFSAAPGQIVALIVEEEADEDDAEAGAAAVDEVGVAATDAVV